MARYMCVYNLHTPVPFQRKLPSEVSGDAAPELKGLFAGLTASGYYCAHSIEGTWSSSATVITVFLYEGEMVGPMDVAYVVEEGAEPGGKGDRYRSKPLGVVPTSAQAFNGVIREPFVGIVLSASASTSAPSSPRGTEGTTSEGAPSRKNSDAPMSLLGVNTHTSPSKRASATLQAVSPRFFSGSSRPSSPSPANSAGDRLSKRSLPALDSMLYLYVVHNRVKCFAVPFNDETTVREIRFAAARKLHEMDGEETKYALSEASKFAVVEVHKGMERVLKDDDLIAPQISSREEDSYFLYKLKASDSQLCYGAISPILMEGVIHKSGRIITSNWKSRWLLIDSFSLYYFPYSPPKGGHHTSLSPARDAKPSGVVPLADIQSAGLILSEHKEVCIQVLLKNGRKLHLMSQDSQSTNVWLEVITNQIKGNPTRSRSPAGVASPIPEDP